MSQALVRALLKEVPLAHIEVYLQVLDSGVLVGRDEKDADNGTLCGGGCDAKGGACGAWCAFPDMARPPWGCFDIQGQTTISKDDFQQAIDDPAAFRKALSDELTSLVRANNARGKPVLGPRINPKLYIIRG